MLETPLPQPTLPDGCTLSDLDTLLIDLLPAAVYVCAAPDGELVRYNRRAAELWGRRPAPGEKFCGSHRLYLPDGTPLPHDSGPMADALRTGKSVVDGELTVGRADGSRVAVLANVSPIRDTAGRVIGAVNVFVDVSDRRRAEEAQARLAAIVASSQDAIISKTVDGVILSWNNAAEHLFGYTAAEAVGRPIYLIIPPERRGEEAEILARLRRGERVEHFETVRVAKDGRRMDISLTISPLRDATGRVVAASKIARDITERVRAERELRESQERYRQAAAQAAQAAQANAKFRAFFEQGTHFACVLTRDGTVAEANRLCLDACGFRREDVVGRLFWECGWWRPSPALAGMVRTAALQAAAGRVFRTETPYHTADGGRRFADLTLAPVTDAAGQVLFVAATGTDVTDRKRMEDELREADRKKDDFIALLAHELRNPLAPIRTGLQVLRRAAGDADALEQARGMMERQLTHMVRMVDDLLDVSRISRNKLTLRRARVPLADVVSSAVETARPLIDGAGHELTVSLPPRPVLLDADHTRLAQVFSNLLTNSAKYTPRGGHIRLAAELDAGDAVVTVRDDGVGIPADALPRLFDMFSQVDRASDDNQGGLGIGLALVKGLVEMHGGTVCAESPGPGRGSTFTVRVPALAAAPEPRPAAAAPPAPQAPGRGRRVLIVDDNRDGAASLAMLLRLLGHDVRTAHDGLEAVEAAEGFRPELILMDVGMPRLDGLDATRRIRERPWSRGVKIVAVTGWGQDADREQSRLAGCDHHLVKPVDPDDLEKLLQSWAEGGNGA